MAESDLGDNGGACNADRPRLSGDHGAGAYSSASPASPVGGEMDEAHPASWFKLSRSILEHPIWVDCPTSWLRVWITLLAVANWSPRQRRFGFEEITVEPGQIITSLEWLALKSKVSMMQVRNALKYLSTPQSPQSPRGLLLPTNSTQEPQKTTSAITLKTTNHGTLITITNWDRYQGAESKEQQAEKQAPQQTNNTRTTNQQQTNNNTSRSIERIEGIEQPLIVVSETPSETTLFVPEEFPKRRSNSKAKLRTKTSCVWPEWKLTAWSALLKEDPKRHYCAGARDKFDRAVQAEADADWLVEVHRRQVAQCTPEFWCGFGKWLAGALDMLATGLSVDEATAAVQTNAKPVATFGERKQQRQSEMFDRMMAYEMEKANRAIQKG